MYSFPLSIQKATELFETEAIAIWNEITGAEHGIPEYRIIELFGSDILPTLRRWYAERLFTIRETCHYGDLVYYRKAGFLKIVAHLNHLHILHKIQNTNSYNAIQQYEKERSDYLDIIDEIAAKKRDEKREKKRTTHTKKSTSQNLPTE